MSKSLIGVPRPFRLLPEEIAELKAEFAESNRMPNPHKVGVLKYTIEALLALGPNQPHPIDKVHEAYRRAAGEERHKRWASGKNDPDPDTRFLRNTAVLQRTEDWGRRLLEVGQKVMGTKGVVIDLTRDEKGELLVTLNTDSDTPLKPDAAPQATVVPGRPQTPQDKPKAKGKGKAPKKAKKPPKADPEEDGECEAGILRQQPTQAASDGLTAITLQEQSMISEREKDHYRDLAAKMMGLTPAEVPTGLLRRIRHVHVLYRRHTAHMDLDIRTLLAALVVEQSGLVPWED